MALERLAQVPWGELRAAFGPAEWIPEALRALLDPAPETRSAALGRLQGGIYHLETPDEATPHVLPFLIELATSTATPDRSRLLYFVGSIIDEDGLILEADEDTNDGTRDVLSREIESTRLGDLSLIHQARRLACLAAAWDGIAELEGLLEDPVCDVRIAASCVIAALARQEAVLCPYDAATHIARRLRESLTREADSLARVGHAFALGTVASRVREARAWLHAVEEAADLADPVGLACALRLIDLGEPFDAPALCRVTERMLRFDPIALDPATLVTLPWWLGPTVVEGLVTLREVEEFVERGFVRLSARYPEIIAPVEQRASRGRGIGRANAMRLASARSGEQRREWTAVEAGTDEDLTGLLAIATVAVREDALGVSRWATRHAADALRQPDQTLQRRASWFLRSLAFTGLTPRIAEFAEVARGLRDPTVIVFLAHAIWQTRGEAALLSLGLLQEWLDARDGPRDRSARQTLWQTIAVLARYAPPEDFAAWLLDRIDNSSADETWCADRAHAVALYRRLRLPEWEMRNALGRWLGADQERMVRRAAVTSIAYDAASAGHMAPLSVVLAALRDDPDAGVRSAAAEAVASPLMDTEYDPPLAMAIVRTLVETLDGDPDWQVRVEAARTLSLAAPSREEAQGVMFRQVGRNAAAGQSAPGSLDAVEALVRAAGSDPSHAVREAAARSLQNVLGAVDGLIALLRSDSLHGRAGAARALESVGKPARAALPELFAALAVEPNETVRRRIAHVACALVVREELGQWIGPLAQAMSDADLEVRYSIAWLLTNAGPIAAPLAPSLIENLLLEDESLRRRSLEALGGMGRSAEAALSAVLALIWSPSIGVRLLALKAAWAINGDRPPHVATLLDAIGPLTEDPARNVRTEVRGLLRAIADGLAPSRPERAWAIGLLAERRSFT